MTALLASGSAAACERPVAEVVAADGGATVEPAGRPIVQSVSVGRSLCPLDVVTAPADGHVVVRMRSGGNVYLPAGAILQLHEEAPDTRILSTLMRSVFWWPHDPSTMPAATARFITAAVESMVPPTAPAVLTRSAGSRDRP